jgi:hypothetical protein
VNMFPVLDRRDLDVVIVFAKFQQNEEKRRENVVDVRGRWVWCP